MNLADVLSSEVRACRMHRASAPSRVPSALGDSARSRQRFRRFPISLGLRLQIAAPSHKPFLTSTSTCKPSRKSLFHNDIYSQSSLNYTAK